MKIKNLHGWNLSEREANLIQKELSGELRFYDDLKDIDLICAVDVAYHKNKDLLIAGAVVLNASTNDIVDEVSIISTPTFPYIPGLFSFREIPPLIKSLESLKVTPDIIICDAQGYAHPNRFGLACHLGVLCDVPTIGCAKNKLVGEHKELGLERGSFAELKVFNEVVGYALRTQDNVKPVFVSPGNRISFFTAKKVILEQASQYRLPEAIRFADQMVNKKLKNLDINNF